jgi:hypothetical protein
MEHLEAIALFWLLPSHTCDDEPPFPVDLLQTITHDIQIYADPDECIDTLTSFENKTILLVLGPGRSSLVGILSTFDNLRFIYLSEPHPFADTTQVRGVYNDLQQLFDQLKKDAKIIENSDTHLHLTSTGEATHEGASTKDFQRNNQAFMCAQLVLDTLLHMPRPIDNVYQDLIKECRLLYTKNDAKKKELEDFEKDYDSSQAIQWYTKDSFVYRLINMALRTENILIIFRFRFIIQDVYKQLKTLHDQKRQASIGKWPTPHRSLIIQP